MYIGRHVKYRYSWQILMKLEFSGLFEEKCCISNFVKICSVGAHLFHTDGQTDMMKLIVGVPNFANAPTTVNKFLL